MQYFIRNHTCTISKHKITYFVVVWLLSCVWRFCNPMDCRNFPHNITRVGLPFSPAGDLPDTGIKPTSLHLLNSRLFFFFFATEPPGKLPYIVGIILLNRKLMLRELVLPNVTDIGWVSRDPRHRKSKACAFFIMLCYLMLYHIHPEW